MFVAIIGAATAIFAATIGIAQNDIKKVLAYSTVSQLGYMFLAAGVGAYVAAIFHLATHAFFKALLFLGSGSVIHAMGGEQDMRKMGGLRKQLPWTYRTFLVGTLAISGVPLLAGFFSKDAILAGAFEKSPVLWIIGLADRGADGLLHAPGGLPDFLRQVPRHPRAGAPSPRVAGRHGRAAGHPRCRARLSPAMPARSPSPISTGWAASCRSVIVAIPGHEAHAAHHGLGLEAMLVGASIAAAAAGLGLAWWLWGRNRGTAADEHAGAAGTAASTVWSRTSTSSTRSTTASWFGHCARLARFCWKVIDSVFIDGGLHVLAFITELAGDLGRFSTTGNVRQYALYFFAGVLVLFWWMIF